MKLFLGIFLFLHFSSLKDLNNEAKVAKLTNVCVCVCIYNQLFYFSKHNNLYECIYLLLKQKSINIPSINIGNHRKFLAIDQRVRITVYCNFPAAAIQRDTASRARLHRI